MEPDPGAALRHATGYWMSRLQRENLRRLKPEPLSCCLVPLAFGVRCWRGRLAAMALLQKSFVTNSLKRGFAAAHSGKPLAYRYGSYKF